MKNNLLSLHHLKMANSTSVYANEITSFYNFDTAYCNKFFAIAGFRKITDINSKFLSRSQESLTSIIECTASSKKTHSDLIIWRENLNYQMLLYKALRFAKGYPIRGQRTHTNAQSAKRLNKRISLI